MPTFSMAESQIVVLLISGSAHGVHLATFSFGVYTWFCRFSGSSKPRSWVWILVGSALFILGNLEICFATLNCVIAFISSPDDPNQVFMRISNWVSVLRSLWYYMVAAVSDAALIYRCWLIYAFSRHRRIVIVLPIALWITSVAFSAIMLYGICILQKSSTVPSAVNLQPYLHANLATAVVLNILTTGLIVYRLWKVHAETSALFSKTWTRMGGLSLAKVMLIIVESALLYTFAVLCSLVLDLAHSNWYYVMSSLCAHLGGICFDLIIIRIWRGASTEQTQKFAESFRHPAVPRRVNVLPADGLYQTGCSRVTNIETTNFVCSDLEASIPNMDDDLDDIHRNSKGPAVNNVAPCKTI